MASRQVRVQAKHSEVMREHDADLAQAHAEIANAQAHVHEALAKANISQVVALAIDKAMNIALKETQRALANTKVDVTVKVDENNSD